MTNASYPFFVTYIENGIECSDHWNAETLNTELNRNEVKILSVELSYSVQVALGLVDD